MSLVLRVVLLVLACAAGAAAQPPISHCSTTGQNLALHDVLQSQYLWYEFLPRLDPSAYQSPADYLEAVRYRPLDRGFSYVTSRAANDAFYDAGQFVGFGFAVRADAAELRVLEVFDGGPAADAGLARGARILEIDGRSAAALAADGGTDAALEPSTVALVFAGADGVPHAVRLTKRPVTIPTIPAVRTFDAGGRRVGYLSFRTFVAPSTAALDAAFGDLRAAGVEELILDLRYNGGGLVDVAVHLASLVGGTPLAGQVFAELRHNARNRGRDRTLRFEDPAAALALRRVIVITGRATASASELVINGLRPFLPVITVGETTYGKPVGQYGVAICDSIAAPVAFASVNADGNGGYFDGLPADCPVADDVDHALGDPAESALATALAIARGGTCMGTASAMAASPGAGDGTARRPPAATGWRALVNAY